MRRVISVTRRHIDFLFAREEPVMGELELRFKSAIVQSYLTHGRARTVTQGAELAWQATRHLFDEGSWLLPTTDDDHTGEDVD
mgnify:CR=1 FL=1